MFEQEEGREEDKNPNIRLDLYNFDTPEAEGSRYVLTSPRSLEACARMGIKPVELLPKNLAELEDEYLPQGMPVRIIHGMFQEHETDRLRKLEKCREIRKQVIAEEKKNGMKKRTPVSSSAKSEVPKTVPGSLTRSRTAWEIRSMTSESTRSSQERSDAEDGTPTKTKRTRSRHPPRSQSATRLTRSTSLRLSDLQKLSISGSRPSSASRRRDSNIAMRRTLSGADLPERDRRIVELMEARRRQEEEHAEIKTIAQLTWEEERERERIRREMAENERKQRIALENRRKEEEMRRRKEEMRREEEALRQDMEAAVGSKMQSWTEGHKVQEARRQRHLQEKKMREMQLKHEQQQRLREKETEMRAFRESVEQQQMTRTATAEETRMKRRHLEHHRVRVKNATEVALYERRKTAVDQQRQQELESLRGDIETKYTSLEKNYQQQMLRRDLSLKAKSLEEKQQLERSRRVREQRDQEMQQWAEATVAEKEAAFQRAHEISSQTAQNKAARAAVIRAEKERLQRENLDRVMTEDSQYREEVTQTIVRKDMKSQSHHEQREAHVQRSRQKAHKSASLRDKVRNEYGRRTFDKMAKEAERVARMGSGIFTGNKNVSTFQIG
ncbi:CCDC177 [Branchiostoma lanceolatum]|uniref:CCDC177 protein n=1 Tax=Branchiostoma lanceolatum TaxID=7740 RepID=A0A8K0ECG1_BRALA|nr:CCDC177 [Branchiostoma lanceolatum]